MSSTAKRSTTPPHATHAEAPFEERYDTAMANERLAVSLTNFQQSWRRDRANVMAEVEFEQLQRTMKAAKTDAIDNLDTYLDQFIAAAELSGTHVHLAADADEANRIIEEIARAHSVEVVAKSKSMVSEETELNDHLTGLGMEVVETDLGEWIVQLRNERPSHMVMPAIHLAREQVGDIFSEHLQREISREDVAEQVSAARDAIRDVFFKAGMGITGANALIAESGTVMMCTNEGNGRLTSSIPPVHVVLAGIEKLVPTYADAMRQLRLLARSATAQRITVYSTFIQGPTPGHEQHVVLVDNGRRAMREREEFREALHCIRCAACANVCPPYREVGGHVFGYIYSGAIGLVVTPFLHGLDAGAGPQSLCLSCNACETVCPVGIPLPRQILDVRAMVAAGKGIRVTKRIALNVYARPRAADLLMKIGSRAQLPLTRGSRLIRAGRLPGLKRQTSWRSLPALARRPLHERVRERCERPERPGPSPPLIPSAVAGMRVALFPGCMTDRLYPEQGEAIATVLGALGAEMVHPEGLHCCGLVHQNSGDVDHARDLGRRTIASLERVEADWIISGSASCVAMIIQDYAHQFRDDPAWRERAERLARRVMDFTSFLVRIAKLQKGTLAAPDGASRTVTYHDSCQSLNALGLSAEPRYLIERVMGDEIAELPENTLCCGFGGTFSVDYPDVAKRLMTRKLTNAEATGAHVIVTDNQGCIMHLRGGSDAGSRGLEVRHLAELLAERVEQRRRADT
ncbi:MAG TPA: LUD domain-containing protein [Thermomicrobiales bacterium]|nr:LUD domain-containing protein [Thermomicrobiales bacterium]